MSAYSGFSSGNLNFSIKDSDALSNSHSSIETSSVTITANRFKKLVLPAFEVKRNAYSAKYRAFSKLQRRTYFWMQLLIKLILKLLWLVALKQVWNTDLFSPGKFIINLPL